MAANVDSNEKPTRMLGGITGKGFMPGQSGNPGGRKKKWLTEVVEELLEEKLANEQDREEYKAHLWQKLCKANVVGAMTLDRVWERTEGKMPSQVTVDGEIKLSISERMQRAKERKSKK